MQPYSAMICYEHEHYVNDLKRKEKHKKDLISLMEKQQFPFLKKPKILRLVQDLCNLKYLLTESEQRDLMLNQEIWSSDCLEYNVNLVYEFIIQNSIVAQKVDTYDIYNYCRVESDMDIKYIRMNDTLRKSKEKNPIIILVSNMFVQPFVINGNHRIRKAYDSNIEKVEAYIIDADKIVHCLISEDYRTAYKIYRKLYNLIGMKLNC